MENVRNSSRALRAEWSKVIAGNDDVMQMIVLALFGNVHILLESVPGLAKTTLIKCMQASIRDSKSAWKQFTPDLKPSDLIGSPVFDASTNTKYNDLGPVVGCNFFLADEINRAPGKTQSSLLAAMQERAVVVGKQEYKLEDPFIVLATMNPIEQEGTFPLPEAQLDRFGLKVKMDYISREDERAMLRNTALEGSDPSSIIEPVLGTADIRDLRKQIAKDVHVSDALLEYVLGLVRASRPGSDEFKQVVGKKDGQFIETLIAVGGSPRAEQTLIKLGRVQAACEGRDYVLPEDIRAIAYQVLRHRIILSQDAQFSDTPVSTDDIVRALIACVPINEDLGLYKRQR